MRYVVGERPDRLDDETDVIHFPLCECERLEGNVNPTSVTPPAHPRIDEERYRTILLHMAITADGIGDRPWDELAGHTSRVECHCHPCCLRPHFAT